MQPRCSEQGVDVGGRHVCVYVLIHHRYRQELAELLGMQLQDMEWVVVVGGIAAFLNSVTVGDSRGLDNEHSCCLCALCVSCPNPFNAEDDCRRKPGCYLLGPSPWC